MLFDSEGDVQDHGTLGVSKFLNATAIIKKVLTVADLHITVSSLSDNYYLQEINLLKTLREKGTNYYKLLFCIVLERKKSYLFGNRLKTSKMANKSK